MDVVIKSYMQKQCNKCSTSKSIECFGKDKYRPDGLDSRCKTCKAIISKKSRLKNPESSKDYSRRYHKINKDAICAHRIRATKTPEERNDSHKKWAQSNKWHVIIAANKRARKKCATPKWLTVVHWKEIRRIYMNCPDGFHVDHILL